MKCRKARKLILSYAELGSSYRNRLDEHLTSCPHCSGEFSLHQGSINAVKEAVSFQESRDFWKGYQVNVERRVPSASLLSKVRAEVEGLTSLFRTPILGPVPAYVFSLVLIAVLSVSLYPQFLSSRSTEAFANDLVAYEGELISAVDDGVETIYTVRGR